MRKYRKPIAYLLRLLFILGAVWIWLAMRSPAVSVVPRRVDAAVSFAILAFIAYVLPLLSARHKIAVIVTMILGSIGLFFIAKTVFFYYLPFIVPVSFILLAVCLPSQSQIRARLSFFGALRYVRRMLRNEPSEREADALAAIRAGRKPSQP